jgi:hypothetical protein
MQRKTYRWIMRATILALAIAALTQARDVYRWAALRDLRTALLASIRPVRLSNCTMKRFGAPNDGGYVLCENLASQVQSAYSYGIDGRDEWGCDVSRAYNLSIHQYDCFNLKHPGCDGAQFDFHEECVGSGAASIDNRQYDSLTSQIAKNGDGGKHLLVKMDVESTEWDAFAATPDSTFENIDQLVVEFHELDDSRYVRVIEKLKKNFYIANVHFNNYACMWWSKPFPALAFEILMVNKRLGVLDDTNRWAVYPNPLDTPNEPSRRDCQEAW